jgi:hypothetical protein
MMTIGEVTRHGHSAKLAQKPVPAFSKPRLDNCFCQ